ncbi:MAG: long-chain fatty acid--CoA ligase [Candidatus Eremiobacteraeota bacterium]|nr:long-chain fatty acid--CoA ligase [Candidatus Eremiobacteraeota bacterium]
MITPSAQPQTLPQLIRRAVAAGARPKALIERVHGKWTAISDAQMLDRVESVACGLRDLGLSAGDRVALVSQNCVDWVIADLGVLFAGCVVVPIFPTQALDQVQYILKNSAAKIIFVDTAAAAKRLQTLGIDLPSIVLFEGMSQDSLAALERRGKAARAVHSDWPQTFERAIAPDDLAVLIYTSGTTGEPKGVMLSHNNIGFVVQSTFSYGFGHVKRGDATLSVLPFSHIYEHMIIYGYAYSGVRHFISHAPEELLADLRDVRPIAMTSVPRIFERLLAGIAGKAKAQGGSRARLVPWALEIGRHYIRMKVADGKAPSMMLSLQYRLANALVLKKLRPLLGLDRLLFFVSGSAPLHLDTAMTMLGFGVTIVEGYGPTECSPTITCNRLEDNRYGTVGKPIPGVQIRLADDGEILAKGQNVMQGYYHNAAATDEVLHDGWYRTGDVGTIDADGYLKITDRKKEIFKTSGGKFISPARVESAIKRSVYVNQVLLVGYGRPHPAALVSANWDMVRGELGLDAQIPPAQLAARSDVAQFLTAQVREQTADLAKFEQVRRVVVLPRELTVENGELSPTLKIKRRVVEAEFSAEIERAYRESA